MKRTALAPCPILAIATGFLVADGFYHHVEAQSAAETKVALDAGVIETHLDGNGPQVAPAVDAPAPIVDAGEDPIGAVGEVTQAYKDGGLVPAVILGAFFLLVLLQKWIPWLREGARKAVVAAVLGGLTLLVERVLAGNTPNLSQFAAAAFAGFMLWFNARKAYEPKVQA